MNKTIPAPENAPIAWMSLRDLATYIGVSYSVITVWQKKGMSLPKTYKIGGVSKLKRADVDVWLEEQVR
jgi:transposase